MKVVGHVGQMRQSACYRQSDGLTCTTCHDPHANTGERADYVARCLNCHADESCRLAKEERLRRSAANDCVSCHMPQVPTEITHLAFTHHRIGIHADRPSAARSPSGKSSPPADRGPVTLVPLDDPAGLSQVEQERDLALAYFAYSQQPQEPESARSCQLRALEMLRGLRSQGWRGPETAPRWRGSIMRSNSLKTPTLWLRRRLVTTTCCPSPGSTRSITWPRSACEPDTCRKLDERWTS